MKKLYIDIETAPSLGYVWSSWKTNVIGYQQSKLDDLSGGRHGYMLCFTYMWEGQKTVRSVSQPDFDLYKRDRFDDSEVVKAALDLLDEADVVVGHNVDAFDIPLIKAFALKAGLPAPSPFRTIDTLKMARQTFRFKSNSLKNLADELGLPAKHDPGGFSTWLGCMDGDPKAWKTMIKYAKRDTELLPILWDRMKPYAKGNLSHNYADIKSCPSCGLAGQMMKRGKRYTATMEYQQYCCSGCGVFSRSRVSVKLDRPEFVAI